MIGISLRRTNRLDTLSNYFHVRLIHGAKIFHIGDENVDFHLAKGEQVQL